MPTVEEIAGMLPRFRPEELHLLECKIRDLYRQRDQRLLYDDAYGLWTMEDQASAAAEVFSMMDEQESER